MYGTTPYSKAEIQSYVPTLVNILKELVARWEIFGTYLSGTVRYNTEYTHASFAGHPDIVTDQCVLDIKNTASFTKMGKESCLQVLAYYALIKRTVPSIRYVGFVLPMQRDIAIYDIGNWDQSRYLQLLAVEADKLSKENPVLVKVAKNLTLTCKQ
jgi:hypothetical protein